MERWTITNWKWFFPVYVIQFVERFAFFQLLRIDIFTKVVLMHHTFRRFIYCTASANRINSFESWLVRPTVVFTLQECSFDVLYALKLATLFVAWAILFNWCLHWFGRVFGAHAPFFNTGHQFCLVNFQANIKNQQQIQLHGWQHNEKHNILCLQHRCHVASNCGHAFLFSHLL